MDTELNISRYLAENMKSLRQKKGWSQEQLAKAADIPRSTISYMESRDGNPSLSNLTAVSAALQIHLEELLARPRSDISLIEAANVRQVRKNQGKATLHKLFPDKIHGLEIDRLDLEGHSSFSGHPHISGTKEYLFVIHGEFVVHVAGDQYRVKRGDVFAFPGDQSHSYRNPLSTSASAISAVIPVPQIV